jgi:hypothetical protein
MYPASELTRALKEWRSLSDRERDAILNDNWSGLAEHQARKSALQEEIRRALALASPPLDGSHAVRETGGLEAVIVELIGLEKRNGDLLATRRRLHEAQTQHMGRTLRDLHGVRRAYGVNRGSHWHSYS